MTRQLPLLGTISPVVPADGWLTPVQPRRLPRDDGEHLVLVKRDDLYEQAGVRGGKVRTCWHLATADYGDRPDPLEGLITAGSRGSPQVNIVAHIAQHLGIGCRAHIPAGPRHPEAQDAQRHGATLIEHRPGYSSVIVARARRDADAHPGWRYIPFGMECWEAVRQTARQVSSIIDGGPGAGSYPARIVVPVGSGMSLAGILHGLASHGLRVPVVGVQVGADPEHRLDQYAPSDWRDRVRLVPSGATYGQAGPPSPWPDVPLDPVYESWCLPHLAEGDLLWVVGISRTAVHDIRRVLDALYDAGAAAHDHPNRNAYAKLGQALARWDLALKRDRDLAQVVARVDALPSIAQDWLVYAGLQLREEGDT